MHKHSTISPRTILKGAWKDRNDIIRDKDVASSCVVLGIVQRFPIISADFPSKNGRMEHFLAAKLK